MKDMFGNEVFDPGNSHVLQPPLEGRHMSKRDMFGNRVVYHTIINGGIYRQAAISLSSPGVLFLGVHFVQCVFHLDPGVRFSEPILINCYLDDCDTSEIGTVLRDCHVHPEPNMTVKDRFGCRSNPCPNHGDTSRLIPKIRQT